MIRPTVIDLNSVGIKYYSFMTSLYKRSGTFNVADDLSTKEYNNKNI